MSRRHAREAALMTLFQLEFGTDDVSADHASELAADEVEGLTEHDLPYAHALVQGTRAHLMEIDAEIARLAKEWKLHRMAAVDRNLIRMAYYEMRYQEERIDPPVAINEAVELAKKYGSDDARRYVNGILAAMQKTL
ncbi:transcription antitermination factor NusB [Selenomonas dianae]|uniref:Transcription antitermination protein NusB n=1 Tax=Selenomonas dianae TaxID=135079 RepID=A0ABN0T9D7_9FIRM|nr:transcription antitermination factor NusB [Selenomonas dianae]WLD81516.1 transcription antitermination factor NusB [Selenomonas dianae]